jgi:glyoxylase-like metal-dependent hydrolase (beta-lactamase superfamily II)
VNAPVRTRVGGLTVHTLTAPEAGWRANCHVVELPERLVLVDAPLRVVDARRVAAEIARLGKPLDQVLLTHAHPDHVATAALFGAPIRALDGVRATIAAAGERQIQGAYAVTGLADPPAPPAIDDVVVDGSETIDGVEFRFETVTGAEAGTQLVIHLPGVVVAGDLVYAGVHPFLAARAFPSWTDALDRLTAPAGTAPTGTGPTGTGPVVLPGHGTPSERAVGETRDYLRAAPGLLAAATGPAELDELLDGAFPQLTGRSMHALQNAFLFREGA